MLWTFVQAFAQNPELIKGVAATLIGLAATAIGDPRIRIAVAIVGMLVLAAYFLPFPYRDTRRADRARSQGPFSG